MIERRDISRVLSGIAAGLCLAWSAAFAVAEIPVMTRALDNPARTRTLQSLSRGGGGHYGKYLSLDSSTGQLELTVDGRPASMNTAWEVKPGFYEERGYKAHVLVSRGNNRFNSYYLRMDPVSGLIGLSRMETTIDDTAKWLVRYAGKYYGYHAFYVQTLAFSEGGFDLSYVAVDERTGELMLSRELTPGAHWHMRALNHLR